MESKTIYMDEYELVRKCAEGNRLAFKQLYDDNSRWLYAVCLRYLPNQEDAQDVLQESFILIYKNLHSFGFEGSFKGWMRRIVVNCALGTFRKKRPDIIPVSAQLYPEDPSDLSLLSEIDSDELRYLIAHLPAGQKQIFMAYAIDGFSHKEIAAMLNISEGTSKSQLYDARKALQTAIKNERMTAKR